MNESHAARHWHGVRNCNLQFAIPRRRRKGYTLLEVILALAILTGALAVLGELVRNGTRNAQMARDLSLAAVICEGKLGEISAGLLPTQGLKQTPIAEYPGWVLSVQSDSSASPATGSANQPGLLKLRVTVEQSADAQRRPVRLTVSEWFRDPATTANANYTPSGAYYDSTGTVVTAAPTQSTQGLPSR
ncbi:MAG TPA: prepilin-type N-terminal cleavage/methylation domain-containing protein [Pirellulales bacterium]|nr:prepilin-type N-terminal cleavage/methylation domain-containing protein [Pirellulales bacterium]